MLTTTFALLRKHGACEEGYRKAAKALGGVTKYGQNTPIPLSVILDSNDLADTIWALRAVPEEQTKERDRIARLFACDCAERVMPIWSKHYPEDTRPQMSIEVARRYAEGQAIEEERAAARAAAWDAAWDAARAAAEAAARAAAWDAAWDAARAAARAAAWDAAWDAARAAAWDAAWAAAWDAARAAAWDAEEAAQVELLRSYLTADALSLVTA